MGNEERLRQMGVRKVRIKKELSDERREGKGERE